jgi:hypothetical protein
LETICNWRVNWKWILVMANVSYSSSSPYYSTGTYGRYLDIMVPRPITKFANDKPYTIDKIYHLRPNLLAFDLYKDSKLWWVFAARNPNVLKDPLMDFCAGTTIYLPTKVTLQQDLGI